ncbi:hypothetical protein Agub_g3277, partial [Astrephomene gubernaculifera]
DTPQDAGFNPVEPLPAAVTTAPTAPTATSAATTTTTGSSSSTAGAHPGGTSSSTVSAGPPTSGDGNGTTRAKSPPPLQLQQQQGVFRAAVENVLKNPYIWALSLTYFFIYVVRQGVTSWTVFYLLNEKSAPNA